MAQWDHGYVTDVAYTTNAYQETSPSWLAACSTILGFRPTNLTGPFRYLDLGCGNGLGALIVAATYPQAEVRGYDFNPTHIENAREMAAEAGLTNVRFEDVSFEALAGQDSPEAFDIIVSHGVLSWVSPENRRHLIRTISRRLQPGGLTYLSYNVSAGWAGLEPLRLLMRQLAEADNRRTDQSVTDIFRFLDQLRDAGAAYFRVHPHLEARLAQMKAQDARYVAHEFLNRDWHPVMFADVAEAMIETRTQYIGSATPMENIDLVAVPEGVQSIVNNTNDFTIRETIRDLGSAKNFRRDLWRKGGERLPTVEHIALLDAITLVWTGKAMDAEFTFPGPIGPITGQAHFYRPLVDAIQEGPLNIGQLRGLPELRDQQPAEFAQAALLLMGGGYVHPAASIEAAPIGVDDPNIRARSRDNARRLNIAITRRLGAGMDMQRVTAPAIGSSIAIGFLEGLMIGRLLAGGNPEPEALIDGALNDMTRSGRSLQRDGQPLRDLTETRLMVSEAVRGLLSGRLPLLRTMGVLD